MTELPEDLKQTQANLLEPVKAHFGRYLFLSFDDQHAFLDWIVAVRPFVQSLEWQRSQALPLAGAVLNLAITRAGLELLRPGEYRSDEQVRAQWDPPHKLQPTDAFAQPMRVRLPLFGEDDSTWSTTDWPPSWTTDLHALAWISGTETAADAMVFDVLSALPAGGHQLRRRDAETPSSGLDHFGFRDGVSQPRIEGVHDTPDGGGAVQAPTDGSSWRLLKAGEFVVGLEDEGGETREPQPVNVLRHATFMALREIRMDHVLLNTYTENVRAAFVGRRPGPNGNALGQPNPAKGNAFVYGDDPEGFACPLGAHVRRSNPRDSLGFLGNLANRHRIIRRGLPYTVGPDRGLVFIALQARLEDQFEFIQGHWLNSGGTLQVGQDPDMIAGVRAPDLQTTAFVVQGRPPEVVVATGPPLTTVRGGEYFVLPTLDGLRHLIDGT